MAREHARVKLSIWADDDFRALSPAAQHLYFVLVSSPKLDYCGVTDWRPARICQLAGGWTAEAVEIAAQELSEQLYVVIDEEAEEVLLRSFVRNDELMEQPNVAVAMKKAHMSIASTALRGIVVHELLRLHADKPDLKGWPRVRDVLERASLDPSDYPTFQASRNPSGNPKPNPSHNPFGWVSPTTTPSPSTATAPAPPTGKTEVEELRENRQVTLRPVAETEPPPTNPADARCTGHRGVADPGPCNGCRIARERAERQLARELEADAREAEALARACTRCDGTWEVDDNRNPTRHRCDHRRRTA